jgi:DNA-directed RNA polymerase specialized sigma24 family protein
VRSAVNDLSPDHAEALVLKYVNGLSTEEVSRVMHKSLPATNSLLQRARNALREALGPSFLENGATK